MNETKKVEQIHKHHSLVAIATVALLVGLVAAGFTLWKFLSPAANNATQPHNIHRTATKKEPPAPVKTPLETENEELAKLVEEYKSTQPAEFYLHIENLETGSLYTDKNDVMVPSGSIYKIFLANQVYKLNEAGKLSMNTPVNGIGLTFQDCTARMVRDSYNACGEAVRSHLGAAKVTRDLKKHGYKCTNMLYKGAAHTCAKDIALLYTRLYKGNYFSKAHTAEFLGYLKEQMWTFRIPEGLPRAPVIAGTAGWRSKTGDVYAFANDSAIILGENTDYIIVVLSGSWPKLFPDSSYAIRHLSGIIYNFMNNTEHKLIY
jgi:hypothetical protein